ncbi:AmmeMemoRadiSam system protein A [Nitrogeniibacter mangrovi]|uniref:AmmeMemoRadiSam system protein A n=1 Tax=Nitrogeniibacter mangrovi TaxID=2016596 RepID=A0A6C1B4X2_9RHOO|nr:AmmeMemoRadiSam system protein A [Nitrogeniibacter mangrovi]QID17818.1 AmmeMemoRadiSam system protein A [Nitrogeniibacter mangrovi]
MSPTESDLGARLLARARAAIEHELGLAPAPGDDPSLASRGATFVTLTKHGELRGCIGSLKPHRPLAEDIAANACAAAFGDPRFPPVSRAEWPAIRIGVSLLGQAEFMDARAEDEVLARLRPGQDGVIFFAGCRQATFLPQVWAQLPEPRRFLGALKQKAGLPPDYWGDEVMIATYPVQKWSEAD